jgi:hypothetical protein
LAYHTKLNSMIARTTMVLIQAFCRAPSKRCTGKVTSRRGSKMDNRYGREKLDAEARHVVVSRELRAQQRDRGELRGSTRRNNGTRA